MQILEGKTNLRCHHNISDQNGEMKYRGQNGNFQPEEDISAKIAQCLGRIFDKVILLMKFLQTNPQVKSLNANH